MFIVLKLKRSSDGRFGENIRAPFGPMRPMLVGGRLPARNFAASSGLVLKEFAGRLQFWSS
jgi:hypothetical protein